MVKEEKIFKRKELASIKNALSNYQILSIFLSIASIIFIGAGIATANVIEHIIAFIVLTLNVILQAYIYVKTRDAFRIGAFKKLWDALASGKPILFMIDRNKYIHIMPLDKDLTTGIHKIKLKRTPFGKKIERYVFVSPERAYTFVGVPNKVYFGYWATADVVDVEWAFVADLLEKEGIDRRAAAEIADRILLDAAYNFLLEQGAPPEKAKKLAPYYVNHPEVRKRVKRINISAVLDDVEDVTPEEGEEDENSDEVMGDE